MNQNRRVVQSAMLAGALAIATAVTGANAPVPESHSKTETLVTAASAQTAVKKESITAGVVKYLSDAASSSLQSASIDVLPNEVLLVAEGEGEDDGTPAAGAALLPVSLVSTALDETVTASAMSIGGASVLPIADPAAVTAADPAAAPATDVPAVDPAAPATDPTVPEVDPNAPEGTDPAADPAVPAEEPAAEPVNPEWATKLMAVVDDSLNVRSGAGEDAEVIGKLSASAAADVIEEADGWVHISSGSVDGWVNKDYCVTGDEAFNRAASVASMKAVTRTGGLRFRAEASEDAGVISTLEEGTTLTVKSDAAAPEGWIAVSYSGSDGYVSADYVDVSMDLTTAMTLEEEQAKIQAEQAEKAKSEQVAATGGATKTAATPASYDDVTLLAALIQCESGSQPYEGQVAVGNVVMNRLHSGAYGGSLSSVIYAPGQFGPAGSGAVARVAAAGPSATAMAAAQAALNGENYIGGCTQFRNIACGHPGTVIGAHVLW